MFIKTIKTKGRMAGYYYKEYVKNKHHMKI